MRTKRAAATAVGLLSVWLAGWLGPVPAHCDQGADLAAARALFEANLEAIRKRDRDAYVACYLDSEQLARTGPEGFELGFGDLASSAGEQWPEVFEAQELRLVAIKPGVVYGTYRYRVRFGGDEQTGLSERLFVETPSGWRIAVTTAFPAPPGTAPPARALVGGTLIDGTGREPVADAVVLIRNGRIECAGSRRSCEIPEGVEVMEVGGRWLTPGLVDAHVHFSQTGWADGRPDFIDVRDRYPYEEVEARLRRHPERFLRAYLCSGVTAVFDNGGYPWTWTLSSRTETDTESPHVGAAGPLLSTLDFWLNLPAERQFIYLADDESARQSVRYLASQGTDAVKVWFIPVQERDAGEMQATVLAAGEEAGRLGLPLIVHATGLREAKIALRAGARLLVHSVWDIEVDDEFIRLARQAGTIYCPTLAVIEGYLRLAEAVAAGGVPVVDDPNGCVDRLTRVLVESSADIGSDRVDTDSLERRAEATAERRRLGRLNLERLVRAGIPVAMGTDAGNPLTLHGPSVYAEMEAMQAAGMTPLQVLVASTLHGARAMAREQDLGTLEPGKIADLLVLDADPLVDIANMRKLRWVVRGGVVRSLEELRAAAGTDDP